MGLDMIEFILAVEECFDIEIPDEVAETLTTPGKVKEYVYRQLHAADSAACLTQRAFYRLRSAAVKCGAQSAGRIRPTTAWNEIAPRRSARRQWWGELQQESGLSLPRLVRPSWMVVSIWILAMTAGATVMLNWPGQFIGSAVFASLAVGMVGGTFAIATSRFRTLFDTTCPTVGAAATHAALTLPARLKGFDEEWTLAEVSRLVDDLILRELNVKEFSDDSHFFKDLKVDS